jgi:hypothetical protein
MERAIEAGYEVYAVIDASGTWNKLVQEVARPANGASRGRADHLGGRR